MIPDLQSSILCDDVRQERNGKFILIGLFDVVASPSYPMVFQRICIVNRWCCGEGSFTEQTRIIGPNKGVVIAEGKTIPVQLPNTECTATNVEFFVNVNFPNAGTYWIEILLDGDMRLRYPLRANLVEQQRPRKGSPRPADDA